MHDILTKGDGLPNLSQSKQSIIRQQEGESELVDQLNSAIRLKQNDTCTDYVEKLRSMVIQSANFDDQQPLEGQVQVLDGAVKGYNEILSMLDRNNVLTPEHLEILLQLDEGLSNNFIAIKRDLVEDLAAQGLIDDVITDISGLDEEQEEELRSLQKKQYNLWQLVVVWPQYAVYWPQ